MTLLLRLWMDPPSKDALARANGQTWNRADSDRENVREAGR